MPVCGLSGALNPRAAASTWSPYVPFGNNLYWAMKSSCQAPRSITFPALIWLASGVERVPWFPDCALKWMWCSASSLAKASTWRSRYHASPTITCSADWLVIRPSALGQKSVHRSVTVLEKSVGAALTSRPVSENSLNARGMCSAWVTRRILWTRAPVRILAENKRFPRW